MRIARRLGAVLLCALWSALLFAAPAQAAHRAAPRRGLIWMITGASLARLSRQPHATTLVRQFFGSPSHSVIVASHGKPPFALPAMHSAAFASYGELRAHISASRSAGISLVVLDLETWSATPQAEQRSPARYYRMAGGLTDRHGIALVATPSPNLVVARIRGGRGVYATYLQSGLIGRVAAAADVFEVQAQGLERKSAAYVQFVRAAAAQARKANPHIVVIAGLSTNPGGRATPARQLYRDVVAARPYVDGFWLNIPRHSDTCRHCGVPRPRIALQLLRMLSKERALTPAASKVHLTS